MPPSNRLNINEIAIENSTSADPGTMSSRDSGNYQSLSFFAFCKSRLWPDEVRFRSNCLALWRFLQSIFPILHWLPNYKVKTDLANDLVTALTIFALHIPQGLAYGRLAGVEPIYGLYVSVFPVLIYAVMGTSRQISIGTFAVASIACNDILSHFRPAHISVGNETLPNDIELLQFGSEYLRPIEVLTALAFLVGLIQFFLGSLRLGVLSILLSDPVLSSFVVGSSLHVFTSQVFALLGIEQSATQRASTIPFELIRKWIGLLGNLPTANLVTIGLSMSTLAILLLFKDCFEPFLVRRCQMRNIALPVDILCIVTLAMLSYALDLNSNYKVAIIPKISDGFEHIPAVPRFDIMPQLFMSALQLSVLIYVSTYSLEKMFASQHGYEVAPNQELLALGTANIASSFLMCYPSSGSLSRSAVQNKVGGRTQLASLISALMVIVFILFLSTYLETLPKCALSCIIIVALTSTMRKFTEFFYYFRRSRLDGLLWLLTFTSVLMFGVDRGLMTGLSINMAFLIVQMSFLKFNFKFPIPESQLYHSLSLNKIKHCICAVSGVVAFEARAPIIFTNAGRFKRKFDDCILTLIKAQHRQSEIDASGTQAPIRTVVFDCSQVVFIDAKGAKMLLEIKQELTKLETPVELRLACCSDLVMGTLVRTDFLAHLGSERCFDTLHGAVTATTKHVITTSL